MLSLGVFVFVGSVQTIHNSIHGKFQSRYPYTPNMIESQKNSTYPDIISPLEINHRFQTPDHVYHHLTLHMISIPVGL